jgi:H+/Na+-translocating ferredoxin:NAD+ oxidoreductase subunit C
MSEPVETIEHTGGAPSHKIGHFDGGIALPPHKLPGESLLVAAVPREVVLPLHQHFGEPAQPCVTAGTRVLRGQIVAQPDGYVSAAVHASTSGTVSAIEERRVPHPGLRAAPCIVIEADGEDRAVEPGDRMDYRSLDPGEVRARVRAAGIVGLGGAAFPTSVKLTARADMHVQTLILNGAECEPYISCDAALVHTRPERIVLGAQIMPHALQVHECLIAVEADQPESARSIEAAIGAAGDERIELVRVPARYQEGGERQLIQVLTGREVPYDGLPIDIGFVCHNLGTAVAVADALDGRALTSRIVTVTGPGVREPHNVEARIGTPVAALIAQCGGYSDGVQRLVMGGPMMGFALATDEVPVVKATNCLLALTAASLRVQDDERPCIRCGECARACPARLLPQELHRHARAGAFEQVHALHVFDCIECGCCDLVCPSHIPLTQGFRIAKGVLWAEERERGRRQVARLRYELHETRKSGEARERAPRNVPPAATAAVEDPRQQVIRDAVARTRAQRAQRDPEAN